MDRIRHQRIEGSVLFPVFFAIFLLGSFAPRAFGQASDLFISEYVEGSSFNKAVEIYNGTGAPVDLGAYDLELYTNGNTEVDRTVNLGELQATLDDDSVIVIKHASFTSYTGPAFDDSVANFNGDDPVVLRSGGTVIDILGEIGMPNNDYVFKDQTLRRNSDVAGPSATYVAAQWTWFDLDTFDGLGSHTFDGAGEPDPEPSEYPSALGAVVEPDGAITLTWTDAGGDVPPAKYAVLVSTDAAPVLPVDGTPLTVDMLPSDGTAAFIVNQGEETATLRGFAPATEYTFTLVPFNNAGPGVDFKTDGAPPAVSITSSLVLLNETFDSLEAWTVVTLGSEPEWEIESGRAKANAYRANGSGAADDWLISRPLDLSLADNYVLSFEAELGFNDEGFNPALSVLVSSDYDGSGTTAAVEAATWQSLAVPLPASSDEGAASTGNVPFFGYTGTVYLAFRYQSSGTAASSSEVWSIDDVGIFPSDETVESLSLSIDPAVVPDDAGADAATATVSIPESLDASLAVSVSNGDTSLLTMPATATIATGTTSTTFVINVNGGLGLVEPVSVPITVSGTGFLSATTSVTVQPAALRVLNLAVDSSVIDEDVGASATTGTVTLSREPESYPFVVNLASSDPGEATVPMSVTFASAAEGLSKIFDVGAVADGIFDADANVTLTAMATDYVAAQTTVTVRNVDAPPAISLAVEPTSVFENAGNGAATLTITLAADPLGGYPVTVNLTADVSGEVAVPASVTISASDNRVKTVALDALTDDVEDGNQTVALTASAANYANGAVGLEVLDVDGAVSHRVLGLLIQPSELNEGEAATGTLFLSTPAASDLTVDLTSGDPSEISVPETVTVASGASVATFAVQALADGVIDPDETVTILATAADWVPAQRNVTVRNVDVPAVLSISAIPSSLDEGQLGQLRVSATNVPAGGLSVTLTSSDATELSLPGSVVVSATTGEAVATFSARVDSQVDDDQLVTLSATAPGYALVSTEVEVRNIDVARQATLTLCSSEIVEGGSVMADLVLTVPVARSTTVIVAMPDELEGPDTVTLPTGADRGSFSVKARADDGFEVDETVFISVLIAGYPGTGASLMILDNDPRGTLVTPFAGARFSLSDPVRIQAAVADPIGSLEAVEFYLDDALLATLTAAPFVATYTPDASLRSFLPLEREITAIVRDSTLGDVTLGPVPIELVFSPLRNDTDFVDQTWQDMTGALPDDETRTFYLDELENGSTREAVSLQMLESAEVVPARQAVETTLLLYDRFPTYAELFVDNLFEVSIRSEGEVVDHVTVPPMASVAEGDGSTFYSDTGAFLGYPDGVRGIAHLLLHKKGEALTRFPGDVASLNTTEFFTPLWRNRHGVEPTPQQILQASSRISRLRSAAGSENAQMDLGDYGRARFVEALVTQEIFPPGIDVIYNPPNELLWEDARRGLLRLGLWRDSGFDRSAIRAGEAGSDLEFTSDLLADLRYWNRFDYMWLNAVPLAGDSPGWYAGWIGEFYLDAATWPWAWHRQHRWIYVGSDDAETGGAWWWDPQLGWMWSLSDYYPWIWQQEGTHWIYHQPGTRDPRVFWDQAAGQWIFLD